MRHNKMANIRTPKEKQMANEEKENSPGRLISEQKRIALIASCPVRKAGKKEKKYCKTCPLRPWCNPDKKKAQ